MKLRISEVALRDLQELGDYIAQDSPTHAERFVARIFDEIESLSHSPLHFPAHIGPPFGFRKAFVQPYVIYFRLRQDTVLVERVLHGSRDVRRLFAERVDEGQ